MGQREGAFGLAEVLITALLLGIVLLCIAQMGGGYARVMRQSSGHDRVLQAAQTALTGMVAEVRGAIALTSPTGATAASSAASSTRGRGGPRL